MAQKDPEKKIPSTPANATNLVAKLDFLSSVHLIAHLAFFATQGIVSIALNNLSFSIVLVIYLSINKEFKF